MTTHTSASVPEEKSPAQDVAYGSAEEMLKRFLKNAEIKYDFVADDEKHSRGYDRYYFSYQGGHFVINVYKTGIVDFFYPGIIEVPIKDLDTVRSVCNQCNMQSNFKHMYEIKEENGMVTIHLLFCSEAMTERSVPNLLEAFFGTSRNCCDQLMKAIQQAKKDGTRDRERVQADGDREFFLVRNQEMAHGPQLASSSTVLSKERIFSLGHLLRDLLDRKDMTITRLQVVDDEGMTVKEASDNGFDDLNLASLIIGEKSDRPAFRSSVVTVIGTYHSSMNINAKAIQVFTITLRKAGVTDRAAFFRMMLTLDPGDASERQAISSAEADKTPSSMSLLLAYDFVSADELRAEADYMWKDAQIKQSDGKAQDLSDEQRLLLDVTDANVAYNMYWGRKYMLSNRYYEAIAHFENAYHALRSKFFSFGRAEKSQFCELAYCLGYCYCELGLYEKAFYYLNIMRNSGNIKYVTEYVNVLANAGDIRVFSEIGMILDDLSKHSEDLEDLPDSVRQLEAFLRRRYAFSLIEFGKLDEAEKAFKELLNDPESLDYALNELAYIKRLRQSEIVRNGEDGEAHSEKRPTDSEE